MPETGYATFGMQSPALELLMKDAEQLGHSDRKRVFRYIGSFTEIAAGTTKKRNEVKIFFQRAIAMCRRLK